jgi:hypothetical protein
MADHLEDFLLQAKNARERASSEDGEFKRQWLKVAEMWELLAQEYRRIRYDASDA